jgi:AraC family transcriptional regulator
MSQQFRSVPVTMGSPEFRSLELDGFGVIEAWFPPAEVLPRHTHDRPCVAVMMDGSFDLRLTGKQYDCTPASVFTEPAGETHANYMGRSGAHVVVIQPDPTHQELLGPFADLLERASHHHHAGIMDRASRLARELGRPDDLSSLAAEGIVLEMLVSLARMDTVKPSRPPRWLLRAQELLHARFAEPIQFQEVAREVGVHPAHLARGFRIHFRLSMGNYVRRLRLDWAARELIESDASLAAVALSAGFSDQSHFTRFFKRYVGQTPNAYRKAMRH